MEIISKIFYEFMGLRTASLIAKQIPLKDKTQGANPWQFTKDFIAQWIEQ